MSQTPSPTLDAFIAALVSRPTSVETFVVSNGENEAVRLVVTLGGIEIAVDVEVYLSPDGCGDDFFDPYLTSESRSVLIVEGVLPEDRFAALQQGSQIASALTVLHQSLIAITAREQFAQHVA